MSSKPQTVGPWVKGYINAVPLHSIPPDGLSDASNCDIDREGTISSRKGYENVLASDAKCMYQHAGKTYALVDGDLCELTDTGVTQLATVQGDIDWTTLNDNPTFCTFDGVFQVVDGAVQALPVGTIRANENDKVLKPLPGGHWIEYWQGRLLLAKGSKLIYSEAMRYGLYNRLVGFVKFSQRISWLAPLNGGVYVGLADTVRFLSGNNPAEFQQKVIPDTSWQGAAAVVDATAMPSEVSGGYDEVAVWMTPAGFAVGHPDGKVVYPQADRLKDIPVGAGKLVVLGDRLTVLSS